MRHIFTEAEPRLLNAMCRLSFASFAFPCFATLFPGSQFQMNWHIRSFSYLLEQVRLGNETRLIANMPPGSLKSFMASIAWPAFVLGQDPTKRIAVVSYSSELAVSLGNNFRQIVSSPWYQKLFPRMIVSGMKNSETEIRTTLNGFRLATTVEGPLTGLHFDIIIIDDPLKPLDAFSDARRERVNTWFIKSVLSRLADPRTGAIVAVMQRLHEYDLSGMLLRSSVEWLHLNLPAIAEEKQWIPISDYRDHVRQVGEVLHPERQSLEEVLRQREAVDAETFCAQWQQAPTPAGGAMIKREDFRYYSELPSDVLASPIFQAWDVASKDGELNDWSVCTTWRRSSSGKYYLLDLLRGRFDYPALRERAIAYASAWSATTILVEDAGLGTALIAEMNKAGLSVIGVRPQQSKQIRLQIELKKFRNRDVLFPRGAAFLPDMEAELLAFPMGRFDDQVDSICLALSREAPIYDLDKVNAGWERLTKALWLGGRFW